MNQEQCNVICELLTDLHLGELSIRKLKVENSEIAVDIILSCRNVRRLVLRKIPMRFRDQINNIITNMLCDATTLDSIITSNHQLNQIRFSGGHHVPNQMIECLHLNLETNKTKVIQNKIIRFYFREDCDLEPFATMPCSVLVKVLSLGNEMNNKLSSIFTLLGAKPELLQNATGRVD